MGGGGGERDSSHCRCVRFVRQEHPGSDECCAKYSFATRWDSSYKIKTDRVIRKVATAPIVFVWAWSKTFLRTIAVASKEACKENR